MNLRTCIFGRLQLAVVQMVIVQNLLGFLFVVDGRIRLILKLELSFTNWSRVLFSVTHKFGVTRL